MSEYKGILSQYNLWGFWNSLPEWVKNKILKYFEETPLMFNYKNLFQDNWRDLTQKSSINVINTLFVCDDLEICDLFFAKVNECSNQNNNEWYWVDLHFFLLNYSKRVYSLYLKGNCNEERFLNSYNIEQSNINSIAQSLKNKNIFPVSNPIIEQYLIYLEKRKEYEKVIELAAHYNNQGWTNDFDKRLLRCKKKLKQ